MNALDQLIAKISSEESAWMAAELGSSNYVASEVNAIFEQIRILDATHQSPERAVCTRRIMEIVKDVYRLGFQRGRESTKAEAISGMTSMLLELQRLPAQIEARVAKINSQTPKAPK